MAPLCRNCQDHIGRTTRHDQQSHVASTPLRRSTFRTSPTVRMAMISVLLNSIENASCNEATSAKEVRLSHSDTVSGETSSVTSSGSIPSVSPKMRAIVSGIAILSSDILHPIPAVQFAYSPMACAMPGQLNFVYHPVHFRSERDVHPGATSPAHPEAL